MAEPQSTTVRNLDSWRNVTRPKNIAQPRTRSAVEMVEVVRVRPTFAAALAGDPVRRIRNEIDRLCD
jgi:hypothetical protein